MSQTGSSRRLKLGECGAHSSALVKSEQRFEEYPKLPWLDVMAYCLARTHSHWLDKYSHVSLYYRTKFVRLPMTSLKFASKQEKTLYCTTGETNSFFT